MIQSVKLSLTVCLSFFVVLPPIASGETTEECNYGINCTCVYGWAFLETIKCNINDTLPVFNTTKKIPDLQLSGNFHTLPSNFFEKLENIDTLTLIQTPSTPPIKANWSDLVFDKLNLKSLEVRNLDGLLPPTEALKALGRKGLRELIIDAKGGNSISLDSNFFSDFKSLHSLRIEGVPISNIDEAAFAGLEDQLDTLALSSASLAEFPTNVLKSMIKLEYLDLSDNGLSQFQFRELTSLTELDSLELSGNKIQEALDAGELTNLPIKLEKLDMRRGGLTKVPVVLLSNLHYLTHLDLGENEITSLKEGDFSNLVDLEYLDLKGNPITSIDNGSLKRLTGSWYYYSYLGLSKTRLTSFDLTLFNESSDVFLNLDENPDLKELGGSKDELGWGRGLLSISMRATGLQKVDQKFKDLIEVNPSIDIILSNNEHIVCDESLQWMLKSVRDHKIKIDNTTCANSTTSLNEYLEKLESESSLTPMKSD